MADSTPLTKKRCVPCEGGVPQLTDMEIEELMPRVNGWEMKLITVDGAPIRTIQKRFQFKNFRAAMSFLREVEEIAEAEGHHPDFCVHYSKVDFTIWTHAIKGLHENDFILAAKIDQLESSVK
jgi:4a-hydroxytetrahydrobiopterin dehydratase